MPIWVYTQTHMSQPEKVRAAAPQGYTWPEKTDQPARQNPRSQKRGKPGEEARLVARQHILPVLLPCGRDGAYAKIHTRQPYSGMFGFKGEGGPFRHAGEGRLGPRQPSPFPKTRSSAGLGQSGRGGGCRGGTRASCSWYRGCGVIGLMLA